MPNLKVGFVQQIIVYAGFETIVVDIRIWAAMAVAIFISGQNYKFGDFPLEFGRLLNC
jgi:hypothetical protein